VAKVVLLRPLSRVRFGDVLVGRAGSIHGYHALAVSVVAAWAAALVTVGPSIESEVEEEVTNGKGVGAGWRCVSSYPWH
jgi:hypothetical protein